MKKNIIITLSISLLTLFSCQKPEMKTATKLWYSQPANANTLDSKNGWKDDKEWLKALPLGNGSLGAMVFGDVNKERIQLNEETMWSGSPTDNNNPNAYSAQKEIRKLLFEGNYKKATELTKKTQICKGKGSGYGNGANVPFGCFQTLGDLWIDFEKQGAYKNYHRELDLDKAVVRVSYTQNGVNYKREIFISQPNQLMVIRLTANKPNKISFKSSLTRPENAKVFTRNNQLIMKGALNNGKGGKKLEYITRLSATHKNGKISYTNNNLVVDKADEVILYLTASTNYKLKYPNYNGRDYKKISLENLQEGKKTSFSVLLENHLEEYQQYYKRVTFKLTIEKDTISTDKRLKKFKETKLDPHLIELIFQYGRYLLIASSRPNTLPANLQGIWANKIQTPWNGDYHTDVNVQMNYWLAESTNLGEMHLPLFDLIASIQKPGAKTAKIHYNAGGWVIHPITNVWGFTAPGEQSSWGMHVGGGAWLATHIMEHYYYTLDKYFLKKSYPVLKASTQFYKDWLIEDPKTGELLSGPSVSPENTFLAPDGSKSQICMGPSHDQQVIWQLFKNFIDASKALNINDDYLKEIIRAKEKLAKPKIAKDGRLMEWNEEFEEVEKGHRHISHLFGLHPGYQIDIKKTPKLALAAKKSLDFRIENGSGYTGWSAAWLVNQYARLGDGNNAQKSLQKFLLKSTSPNLFGMHPPFQIDGNFGITAGIAEMLLQSQSEEIRLLPALPLNWKSGVVKGLSARGGFTVDMQWEKGKLTYVKVHSKKGGICKIEYKGKLVTLETESGKEYFPLKLL